jgi:hypothetical protein
MHCPEPEMLNQELLKMFISLRGENTEGVLIEWELQTRSEKTSRRSN